MNYKKYLIIAICFIIVIILYGLFALTSKPKFNLRDSNKEIIYNIAEDSKQKIPYLNLIGEDVDFINEDIIYFINNEYDNNTIISYKYNKYGSILSLIVKVVKSSPSNAPIIKFRSYNIIITKGKLLSNDELFSIAGMDKENTNNIINNLFIDFYNESEIRNHLNYEEYIKNRNIYFNINDDVNYYIENNKIYSYININCGMDFEEYEFFNDNEYKVLVGGIDD